MRDPNEFLFFGCKFTKVLKYISQTEKWHNNINIFFSKKWYCFQIADALYYNAALTLSILQKLGVASEIFHLWFHLLQQVKKSGLRANFKRYALFLH